MPFETRRIISDGSSFLVEVTYTVERRKLVPVAEGQNEKQVLGNAEQHLREDILKEIMQELNLVKGGEGVARKEKIR